jgi:hypothetical protein
MTDSEMPILTFGAMSYLPRATMEDGHLLWEDFDFLVAWCPKTERRQRCREDALNQHTCSGCDGEIVYERRND